MDCTISMVSSRLLQANDRMMSMSRRQKADEQLMWEKIGKTVSYGMFGEWKKKHVQRIRLFSRAIIGAIEKSDAFNDLFAKLVDHVTSSMFGRT